MNPYNTIGEGKKLFYDKIGNTNIINGNLWQMF